MPLRPLQARQAIRCEEDLETCCTSCFKIPRCNLTTQATEQCSSMTNCQDPTATAVLQLH